MRESIAVVAAAINLLLVATLFGQTALIDLPWLGTTFPMSLRVYHTANFITTAAAGFGLLVTIYSLPFMRKHHASGAHYALLLVSLGLVNGAVFANSLLLMLFFWEGLLGTTYGMIAIGRNGAFKTATKALIISGFTDLCLMFGIALVWAQAKTVTMTELHLPLVGTAPAAFVLLMIGAVAKGGSMPFHSWIPDAAVDAPTPFMAFLPGSIEKLLGVYLLSRIALDFFQLTPTSWLSTLLMVMGSITILLAVSMALIQKDFKRLLAFQSVSQIGYMMLGIGTALPVGVVGGLFHMLNHTIYKCCLFFTSGAVERQTGTTDLAQLGGIGRKMPLTFACFLIAAASGAGLPPFGGFFSKELVYDGALERGTVFYLVAVTGSFLAAAAFLKLGHAAFLGPRSAANEKVVEAPSAMLVPMFILAAACVYFGLANEVPIQQLIVPMLPDRLVHEAQVAHAHFTGWPTNSMLILITAAALLGACWNHVLGVRLNGGGLQAADHIYNSPELQWLFQSAERGWFDPYELFMKGSLWYAYAAHKVDRANDWLFGAMARLTLWTSRGVGRAHKRNYTSTYILWSLAAATLVILYLGQ
jgi:formate hydrogenlyase subunit 3/multisubunit Na+/H+ antiporter MnhD subunit